MKVTNLGVFTEPVVVKVSDVDFDYCDIGFWRDKKYHREVCKNFEIVE